MKRCLLASSFNLALWFSKISEAISLNNEDYALPYVFVYHILWMGSHFSSVKNGSTRTLLGRQFTHLFENFSRLFQPIFSYNRLGGITWTPLCLAIFVLIQQDTLYSMPVSNVANSVVLRFFIRGHFSQVFLFIC